MAVAALYDIHGNLPALEAVLEEIERSSVHEIVVGGDVYPGPLSHDCLARLLGLDLPVRFLRGNGDRAVLTVAHGGEADSVPVPVREAVRRLAERLDADHLRAMESWPASLTLEVDGFGEVLFCHATPRSDTEVFTRLTPADRLAGIFDATAAELVVCGHTHMQFDRRIGRTRVVNAGSVGMPFGAPGAYWLLLGEGVDLRRTDYDLDAAADRVCASDYPQASEFAARNILQTPSEREMLELFERAAVR